MKIWLLHHQSETTTPQQIMSKKDSRSNSPSYSSGSHYNNSNNNNNSNYNSVDVEEESRLVDSSAAYTSLTDLNDLKSADNGYAMPCPPTEFDSESPRSLFRGPLIVTIFVALVIVSIVLMSGYTTSSNDSLTPSFASPSSFSISISLANNDYGAPDSLKFLPWDAIIEPFRGHTASVLSFVKDGQEVDLSGSTVEWSICDGRVQETGAEIAVVIEGFIGECTSSVTIREIDDNTDDADSSEAEYTYEFLTVVKYVRRELRSMTVMNQKTFFSALKELYSTSTEEGQAKYGSKYKSAEYFAYKHLNGAGTADCDHWHDGAGILTHHVAFILEVEQALQAIDPSISMPYWEYSMDIELYDNWMDSPVFAADWFGEMPTNDDHVIRDGGFWDGLEVPDGSPYMDWDMAVEGYPNPFVNAYGYLRSPWNNNPTPLIGRYNMTYMNYDTTPSCSVFSEAFDTISFSDLSYMVNGGTHGPIHIMIGGAWGLTDSDYENDALSSLFTPGFLLNFKVLWRTGYTRCPETCDESLAGSSLGYCSCSIPPEYWDTYQATEMLESTTLDASYTAVMKSNYYEGIEEDLLKTVQTPRYVGDMFSSNAAYDPSFWPLHGSIERLVGIRRIFAEFGYRFDDSWGYPTYSASSGAKYLEGVCDWSNVASVQDDLTLPVCDPDEACFGHAEDDLMEFSGFVSHDDVYTNGDFYEFLHPWTVELPYTYDTYDYDYCLNQDVDMFENSKVKNSFLDLADGDIFQKDENNENSLAYQSAKLNYAINDAGSRRKRRLSAQDAEAGDKVSLFDLESPRGTKTRSSSGFYSTRPVPTMKEMKDYSKQFQQLREERRRRRRE